MTQDIQQAVNKTLRGESLSVEEQQLLKEALKYLTYREREIFNLRYGLLDGEHYTFENISHIFKITRERVRQIEANVCRKLSRIDELIDRKEERKAREDEEHRHRLEVQWAFSEGLRVGSEKHKQQKLKTSTKKETREPTPIYYITRYWETAGILKICGNLATDIDNLIRRFGTSIGNECWATESDALAHVEKLRREKITALKGEIEKLEKLSLKDMIIG